MIRNEWEQTSVTAKPLLEWREKMAETETHCFPCQGAAIIEYSQLQSKI